MRAESASEVVVAVATYKRPEGLRRLLGSLREGIGELRAKVIVVDNDPGGSAHHVVLESDLDILYVIESRPGIAAARNRALSEALEAEFVAFIDDDEEAHPGWLEGLVKTASSLRADVVGGPVVAQLPESCPSWIGSRAVFSRRRHATGSIVDWPATNNCIIRTRSLSLLAWPRFAEEFSATGGSDAELMWRLRRAGARLVWCDEAVVSESIPESRATLSWIVRRGIRLGNVSARLLLRDHSRGYVSALGMGRLVFGLLSLPYWLLRRSPADVGRLLEVPKAVGTLQVCIGRHVIEYRREGT